MANLYGYNSTLIVVPEDTYGSEFLSWKNGVAFNNTTIEMESNAELVQRLIRSGTISETSCENVTGKVSGTATVSGVLTQTHAEWLSQALALDNKATSPIDSDDVSQTTAYSYKLIRRYSDTLADVAFGAVLTSLEYSTDDNFVNFTATFDVQEVKRGQFISSITEPMPTVTSCEKAFTVAEVTYTRGSYSLTPLSFTVSFTNELDEDKINYGTSLKKTSCLVSKTTGTLTLEGLHDSVNTMIPAGTVSAFSIGIGSHYDLDLYTMVETANIPDSEQGAYIQTYTSKIVKGDSVPQYKVTFS